MPEALRLDQANLAALWVEAILYGAFLILFGASIYVLLFLKQASGLNRMMALVSVLMFALITAHIICDVIRAMRAFTKSGNAVEFYKDIAEPSEWAKTIIYTLLSLLGDAMVVFRCWIVWGGNPLVMAVPCTLLLLSVVMAALVCQAIAALTPGEKIFTEDLARWLLPFFSLTFVTNNLCTLLIAGRICWTTRRTRQFTSGDSRLWRVIVMLIESAALYSIALIAMIGTFVAGSNAQYITIDALCPMIGIAFELIIVRVGLGISAESEARRTSLPRFDVPSPPARAARQTDSGSMPIQITRTVTTESDYIHDEQRNHESDLELSEQSSRRKSTMF